MGKKENVYLCSKWPSLDLVIKPHPTKDREGNTEGVGHHITFKNGRFSTSQQDEIDFIEENDLFKSGIIVDAHEQEAKEIALKKAKLDAEAKALGFKLIKA